MNSELPPLPAKRYFTTGEVAQLCGVKPHVLRYWEQEFTQLRPMKRRGNRRYYQHHEVLMIRRIRELLYEQGFTISGARNRLQELGLGGRGAQELAVHAALLADPPDEAVSAVQPQPAPVTVCLEAGPGASDQAAQVDPTALRRELEEIRAILF